MMDGVAVEAPRCLGRIAMMDGVAVEAPRVVPPRRCALESDVRAGRVDTPRPALRVLSSRFDSLWARSRAKRGTDKLTH